MFLERQSQQFVWTSLGMNDADDVPSWILAYAGIAAGLVIGLLGFCLVDA